MQLPWPDQVSSNFGAFDVFVEDAYKTARETPFGVSVRILTDWIYSCPALDAAAALTEQSAFVSPGSARGPARSVHVCPQNRSALTVSH